MVETPELELLLPGRSGDRSDAASWLNMDFSYGLWMDSYLAAELPSGTLTDFGALGVAVGLDIYGNDEDRAPST